MRRAIITLSGEASEDYTYFELVLKHFEKNQNLTVFGYTRCIPNNVAINTIIKIGCSKEFESRLVEEVSNCIEFINNIFPKCASFSGIQVID